MNEPDTAAPSAELLAEIKRRVDRGELDASTLALAEQMIEREPASRFGYVIASRCLEADGRLEDALARLDQVLARYPGDMAARNRRADLLRRIAARERAEHLLTDGGVGRLKDEADAAKTAEREIDFQIEARRILVREDGTTGAICALGAALRHRKDFGAALAAYDEARQLDDSPNTNDIAYVGLAAVLRDLKRTREADDLARQALAYHPTSTHALSVVAAICLDDCEAHRDRARLTEAEQLIKPKQSS